MRFKHFRTYPTTETHSVSCTSVGQPILLGVLRVLPLISGLLRVQYEKKKTVRQNRGAESEVQVEWVDGCTYGIFARRICRSSHQLAK